MTMARTYKFKSNNELIEKSTVIFETLGLTLDSAINLFLRQSLLKNGLPFSLTLSEDVKEKTASSPINDIAVEENSRKKKENSSEISKQIGKIKEKLAEKAQSLKVELSEEEKNTISKNLAEMKEKLAKKASNQSVSSEDFERRMNLLKEATEKSSKLSDSSNDEISKQLANLKEKLALKSQSQTQALSQTASNDEIKARLASLKEKLAENFQRTPATSEEKKTELSDIEKRVAENEKLVKEARREAGLSDNEYLKGESQNSNAEEQEPIPTVSDVVNEVKKTQEQKVEQKSSTEHEEDEDETAPDTMFDSWDAEEEIGCK